MKCIAMGCMLSMPGSDSQPMHQDGPHYNEKQHAPPYAINVFLPLVDISVENGGTEFWLATHRLGHYDDEAPSVVLLAKAGTPLLFDYRVRHRGLANRSQTPRPMLYVTFAKKNYKDSANFSAARYRKLPKQIMESAPAKSARESGGGAAAAASAQEAAAAARVEGEAEQQQEPEPAALRPGDIVEVERKFAKGDGGRGTIVSQDGDGSFVIKLASGGPKEKGMPRSALTLVASAAPEEQPEQPKQPDPPPQPQQAGQQEEEEGDGNDDDAVAAAAEGGEESAA